MFFTFLIMAGIEISLLIDKPNARYFALTILAGGLVMRELAKERAARKKQRRDADRCLDVAPHGWRSRAPAASTVRYAGDRLRTDTDGEPMLVAVRGTGRTLDFSLRKRPNSFGGLFTCCSCASRQ